MGWTTLEQRIARTELLINTILNDAELKAAALSTTSMTRLLPRAAST